MRAQVTLFIILGTIFVLAVVMLVIVARVDSAEVDVDNDMVLEQEIIQTFFDSCVRERAWDALDYFGEMGGMIDAAAPSEFGVTLGNSDLSSTILLASTALIDGSDPNPMESIEAGITDALIGDPNVASGLKLATCMQKFDLYVQQTGWSMEKLGELSFEKVKIAAHSISFHATYPVRFTKDKWTFSLKDSYAIFPINLQRILKLRDEIYNRMMDIETAQDLSTFSISGSDSCEDVQGKIEGYVSSEIQSLFSAGSEPYQDDLGLVYANYDDDSDPICDSQSCYWVISIIDLMGRSDFSAFSAIFGPTPSTQMKQQLAYAIAHEAFFMNFAFQFDVYLAKSPSNIPFCT